MGNKENKSHLLLVHEDRAFCLTLSTCLEQSGYRVSLAESGQQALDMLGAGSTEEAHGQGFDMALLATRMPDMAGSRILEKMTAAPLPSQIPALMISTGGEDEEIIKCLELGAVDYLQAPFKPALVKTRIGLCLEREWLKAQKKRQEQLLKFEVDMKIGHQIQLGFLPSTLPKPSGWQIGARCRPAREVGGDFFDAFNLPGDRVGLVIADVCDKGVGPALFMALSRSLIRAFSDQHRPLGWMGNISDGDNLTVMKRGDNKRRRLLLSAGTGALLAVELTNNYITNNHSDMNMFATLFFGVLDPATGILTYINGGHDSPAIVSREGVVKARLLPTGPAIGLIPDVAYGIQQATLDPGDLLMAFTDGVTDALNPKGELFSEEGLFPLLGQPASSVEVLLDRILNALDDHIAEAVQFDDITMLIARRELR